MIRRENPSQKATFFQVITIWLTIISMCLAVQILEHLRNIDPFNYFCFPFTTLFPSDPLIFSFQIVMLSLDSLLVMATVVSYSYLLVFTTRTRRNKALRHLDKRQEKLQKFLTKLTVLILSTVVTWIPLVCVQSLVLLQITILQNVYFWCILVSFSVNLIIDPTCIANQKYVIMKIAAVWYDNCLHQKWLYFVRVFFLFTHNVPNNIAGTTDG